MRIPNHIAIIPDGNRRWAQSHGLTKEQGYAQGLRPGLGLLRQAKAAGVQELTFYGFTVDNCKRPPAQVAAFREACVRAVELLAAEGAELLVLGNTASLLFPPELLPYTQRQRVGAGGLRLNFLVNYGWDWDLSSLSEATPARGRSRLTPLLHSADVSRIDLIVRWGGRRRLSGLLPVQAVYADFFVLDDLWPDWQPSHLAQALEWWRRQDVTLGG